MPRKKFRSFDCYPDDFLTGTAGMEPTLFKAHTRLFMKMYSDGGPLKYEPRTLMWTIEAKRPADAKRLIERLIATRHYFLDTEGYLHHPRVDKALGLKPKRASNEGSNSTQTEVKPTPKVESTAPNSAAKTTEPGTQRARARAPSSPSTSPHIDSSYEESSQRPNGRVGGWADVQEALRIYHDLADRVGLPKIVMPVTEKRRKKLKAILDKYGLDRWREAMERVEESDFCRGLNDRAWRANIEFLSRPDSFSKLLEGAYSNRVPTVARSPPVGAAPSHAAVPTISDEVDEYIAKLKAKEAGKNG